MIDKTLKTILKFNRQARQWGLPANLLGSAFHYEGETYFVTGFHYQATKYRVCAQSLRGWASECRFTLDFIRSVDFLSPDGEYRWDFLRAEAM